MANKKSHHVVRNPSGGWDVKKAGSARASGHYKTQKDAIDSARKISSNQGSELYIHGRDGRIRAKDSHGNDPYPPKG